MVSALFFYGFLYSVGFALSAQTDWKAFENGKLGPYPQAEYRSTKKISSPLIHTTKQHKDCDDNGYVLLSPDGPHIPGNKAMMVDGNGDLVWYQKEFGTVKSMQVQKFKGEQYLTYWVGDDSLPGHGRGFYKMLDKTYSLAYAFGALNNRDGDYHEFTITPQNTAIITIYEKAEWDLKTYGLDTGYIWDCLFQEIDIEHNLLLFEWRASDHFKFTDMSVNSWEESYGSEEHPWDWFHLNSVQKDAWGNYLIAARYTNAVSYISGSTGQPLWHLGGIRNSFQDLTGGNTTAFVDPHMARWADTYSAITLFDNVAFQLHQKSGEKRSSPLKITIDSKRHKVVSTTEFTHPQSLFALSEGSMQRLDNGNYFVGYGSTSTYSEFSPDGALICNANYSPLNFNVSAGEPHQGAVESYRVYKSKWIGEPKTRPDTRLSRGMLYVSWNGATEVHSWKVAAQGISGQGAGEWVAIGLFPRTGFETIIDFRSDSYSLFRLEALDRSNNSIRAWSIEPEGSLWELYVEQPRSPIRSLIGLLFLSFILGCACVLFLLGGRSIAKRRSVATGRSRRSFLTRWLRRGRGPQESRELKKPFLSREPV